eukprot:125423_1
MTQLFEKAMIICCVRCPFWLGLCVVKAIIMCCIGCKCNQHSESTINDETDNRIGQKVKAKEKRNNPTFYDATIKEINDGSVKVGHDGYPAKYDPCITKSKLKTHITINVNN